MRSDGQYAKRVKSVVKMNFAARRIAMSVKRKAKPELGWCSLIHVARCTPRAGLAHRTFASLSHNQDYKRTIAIGRGGAAGVGSSTLPRVRRPNPTTIVARASVGW
jgi:hypothetical protein